MTHDEETVSRFPLQWPSGWVRTLPHRRGHASFSTKKIANRQVTVAIAVDRLQGELDRLGARNPTLSTNVQIRLDGRPYSDIEPKDPGVAVYFSFKGKATVFACDKYLRVADNIAAIAAHIDALRRIERYGVGSLEQALAGYKALPADTAADWRQVFGFTSGTPTLDQLDSRYKEMARTAHPDVGGTDDGMAHLNRAREFALLELNPS